MEQDLKKQHEEIYLRAMEELIKNNTKALIENDLLPLFEDPPLEAMDTIKQKLLSYAKTYQLILNTEEINKRLKEYRKKIKTKMEVILKVREKELLKKLTKEQQEFKLLKKDLTTINKTMKKEIKESIISSSKILLDHIDNLYTTSEEKDKLVVNLTKFLNVSYPKQILDTIDMKILLKDTILINGIKEQTERYKFTKENSHLFD